MENRGSFPISYQYGNVVAILSCLLTICGLLILLHFYHRGIRYMYYFLPTFVIRYIGVVYFSVTIWTFLGFNGMSFCKLEKLEELLVMIVIESYIIVRLYEVQATKYNHMLRIVVWLLLVGTQFTMFYRFITAEDGASCDQPENGLRTIIDTHLIYVFIMLPQFTMVASIIFIFPDTDEEENIISEGNKSSPEIQPMCTEIKVHSPPEVATIRDCPPCTYATALNNADENLTRSSKHPPYEDVTASHLCSSYDSVTASCHCLSCDGVAASRYCLSCDGVTVSRHSSSFNGVTASPYCQASLNYLACNTSRLCVSCAYLKLSQFIIFVYLSFVIWGMKPVSILLQEFRCIDRQNIVNGFILLPPFVFSSGIYLLTIFSPLVLSLSHK